MQSCPVLSEVSKKRLFSVLRQCSVAKYRYGEMAYREGEPMKDCLYLVRSGEFSFSQKDPKINKAVEVLNFKAGYIFRHENRDNIK